MKALVTGANSTVAQSIIKALRRCSFPVEIVATDIQPYSPGLYQADKAYLVKPFVHPDYESQMLGILHREKIDALFPAVVPELPILAARREVWEQTGAKVLIGSPEAIAIASDKYLTARFLESHGLAYPQSALPDTIDSLIGKVGFPLILKPRKGANSKGLYRVESRSQLEALIPLVEDPVIQEYLGSEDEEYTCGVFADAQGSIKGVLAMRRQLVGGVTSTGIVDRFPEVERIAAAVVKALGIRGTCNVQLRIGPKGPTAFEINPRFSSSVAMRCAFGFNEAEAALRSFVRGEQIPALRARTGVAMRYWNEIYTTREEIDRLLTSSEGLRLESCPERF